MSHLAKFNIRSCRIADGRCSRAERSRRQATVADSAGDVFYGRSMVSSSSTARFNRYAGSSHACGVVPVVALNWRVRERPFIGARR
jgi:hypothetical protein